ncbi:MAG: hypothetical protein KGI54_16295 [Pseudomonadota bacterium]|nr:hypothetical protein [Pseudomonadota bacterium]
MTNTSELLIELERKIKECGWSNAKGPTEKTLQLAHEISKLGWQLARQCDVEMAAPRFEAMGK